MIARLPCRRTGILPGVAERRLPRTPVAADALDPVVPVWCVSAYGSFRDDVAFESAW